MIEYKRIAAYLSEIRFSPKVYSERDFKSCYAPILPQ